MATSYNECFHIVGVNNILFLLYTYKYLTIYMINVPGSDSRLTLLMITLQFLLATDRVKP